MAFPNPFRSIFQTTAALDEDDYRRGIRALVADGVCSTSMVNEAFNNLRTVSTVTGLRYIVSAPLAGLYRLAGGQEGSQPPDAGETI